MSTLAPVPPRERVVTLDVLRGIALCGVLLGNMRLYSGSWAGIRGASDPPALDEIAEWFLMIFVDSKAQTLLTLLFGFGFAMQLLRAEERGEPVLGLYVRRLVVMFGFGALHVTLFWWGDVIWGYAITGFGMLAFMRTSNRTRLVCALVLTFVPILVVRSSPEIARATMSVLFEPREFAAHTRELAVAIQEARPWELPGHHLPYALAFTSVVFVWYFPWTLGRFLLGYVAGERRWFDADGAGHLHVFRALAIWCGALAVVTTALRVLRRLDVIELPRSIWGRYAGIAIEQVALLAVALAGVAIVVLVMQRARWRRVLSVLAPAGRMPLTVYTGQSVICTPLFYGWGLGLAGSIGMAGCVGLAFAIFGVQVALCHLWLRRFRFGPLEWLWRSAVYLKLQPMRRTD